jgi:cysteine desulfurase
VFAHWDRVLPATGLVAVNPTEHPCVLEAARGHLGEGRIVLLGLNADGVVDNGALRVLLQSGRVGAVAVMAANHETGVLQPWAEIAALCRTARVEYLCDATQWLGKLPASGFGDTAWVVASAHKFGGPKGVGLLQLPAAATGFHAQLGGAQEHDHRAGTENYPGVASMLAALKEAETTQMLWETERLRWRDRFEQAMVAAVPGTKVVATRAERLWNTVALAMPYGENHRWVARLDRRKFQVSTGSACATGKEGPSPVLTALGLGADEARRVVRVSAGWETTDAGWQELAATFAAVAPEVRPTGEVVAG